MDLNAASIFHSFQNEAHQYYGQNANSRLELLLVGHSPISVFQLALKGRNALAQGVEAKLQVSMFEKGIGKCQL
jgi:hypothetical protein